MGQIHALKKEVMLKGKKEYKKMEELKRRT
jgi:hypothetical protein